MYSLYVHVCENFKPSLLPGDPAAEFAGAEAGDMRDDSDVDVDGLLELDSKGEVVRGNYGVVRIRKGLSGTVYMLWGTRVPTRVGCIYSLGVRGYLPEYYVYPGGTRVSPRVWLHKL